MYTNSYLIDFFRNNSILLVLLLLSAIHIIPQEWAGYWKYNNNRKEDGRAPRMTILHWLLTSLLNSIINAFIVPLIAAFGLDKMVTLIIFAVVGFDIFSGHEISSASVILTVVGIIALYLDRLVDTGKIITMFGGLLHWEKDDRK
jgi:hypothetical protein